MEKATNRFRDLPNRDTILFGDSVKPRSRRRGLKREPVDAGDIARV